jgi:hypothetical protein
VCPNAFYFVLHHDVRDYAIHLHHILETFNEQLFVCYINFVHETLRLLILCKIFQDTISWNDIIHHSYAIQIEVNIVDTTYKIYGSYSMRRQVAYMWKRQTMLSSDGASLFNWAGIRYMPYNTYTIPGNTQASTS